jgi:pyroglutamyl-peptidase
VVIPLDADPVVIDGAVVIRPTLTAKHRLVKISALEIPVEYEAVKDIVPKLHLRPPMLPDSVNKDDFYPLPPDKGYDFIFHVGVAGRGPLRMEKLGHKLGYYMKDATGKMAPVVKAAPSDFQRREDLDVSIGEQAVERIGLSFELENTGDAYSARPSRGFGVGYEKFPDGL